MAKKTIKLHYHSDTWMDSKDNYIICNTEFVRIYPEMKNYKNCWVTITDEQPKCPHIKFIWYGGFIKLAINFKFFCIFWHLQEILIEVLKRKTVGYAYVEVEN